MVTLAWAAGLAAAQTVTFDLNDQQAQDLGVDTAAIEDDMGAAVSDQLNLVDPTGYLEGFANAAPMALKGMGVDYASNPKKFSIGGTLGTSVSGVPLSFARGPTELPEGGFAFMASATAGVNIGMFVPGDNFADRLSVYVNGLAFNPPGNRSFKGSMYNVGAHAQVKLVGPLNVKVVEWGGLDVTTGFEKSFYALSLSQGLPITQNVSPGTVTWTATGTYDIRASSTSIPLELSSNLRVLVATVYVGGGADFNFANAGSEATLSGPVDVSVAGQSADVGTIGVSLGGEGLADKVAGRAFVGAQVNVLMFKVFGHLNLGTNETYGGFIGARVAL